jgi:tetratricopeptide (TPR) repeat protein
MSYIDIRARQFGKALCILLVVFAAAVLFANSGNAFSVPFGGGREAQRANANRQTDDALAQSVLKQLLVVSSPDRPAGYAHWPPKLDIISSESSDARFEGVGKYNAFATAEDCIPSIRITDALLHDVIESDPDRLALVLGHELSHILLGHTTCVEKGPTTSFLHVTFTRDQEYAADKNGLILMQRAGYSARKALKVFEIMDAKFGYSSFEALGVDHPSFKDRIAALDKDQAPLWRSMSSFQTGTFFLTVQQYASAEDCFASVVKAYPDAYEGWLNLGYARLMRYADAMTSEDLERLRFEHVVASAFLKRPDTLAAKVRGVDSDLWAQAMEALQHAATLKPDSPVIADTVAIGYLLSPEGPQPDRAIPQLQLALSQTTNDKNIDPAVVASIKINLAAADLSAQKSHEARELLDSAEKDSQALQRNSATFYFDMTAIQFNYARSFGLTPQPNEARKAVTILDQYLSIEDPGCAWWPLAYKRYQLLADKYQLGTKTPQEFAHTSVVPHRPVVSLELAPNTTVTIGQSMSSLAVKLGRGVPLGIIDGGSGLKRVKYPSARIDAIGNANLLAISLSDPSAPPVKIRRYGTTAKIDQLRVGMDAQQLGQLVGKEPITIVPFLDLTTPYYFMPYLGVGLRLGSDKRVSEIIIAQIPVEQ